MKPPRPLAFRSLFQSEIDSFKNILPSRFVGVLAKNGILVEKAMVEASFPAKTFHPSLHAIFKWQSIS
jgi:hypothetical protein